VSLRAAALNHRGCLIRKACTPASRCPSSRLRWRRRGGGGRARRRPVVARPPRGHQPHLGWGPDDRVQGPSYRILGLPDNGTYAGAVKTPAEPVREAAALSWEAAAAIPPRPSRAYRVAGHPGAGPAGRDGAHHRASAGGRPRSRWLIARHVGARVIVTSSTTPSLPAPASSGATAA